jgi:phosphoribosylpyrophosphate synthetase
MVEVQKSVRGSQVFLIQPTSLPVDENLFELFLHNEAMPWPMVDTQPYSYAAM